MEANLSWITESLATGGDFSQIPENAALQMQDIIDQDVELVIDIREEDNDKSLWDSVGMNYVHLPSDDAYGHVMPASIFDRACEEAKVVMEGGGKVFVHCHMGVNRGPSVAFAILLDQGMDPVKAYDLIIENRPQAGLAYVMDALAADQERNERRWPVSDEERLKRHINKTMTPERANMINAHITRGHQTDYEEQQKILEALTRRG